MLENDATTDKQRAVNIYSGTKYSFIVVKQTVFFSRFYVPARHRVASVRLAQVLCMNFHPSVIRMSTVQQLIRLWNWTPTSMTSPFSIARSKVTSLSSSGLTSKPSRESLSRDLTGNKVRIPVLCPYLPSVIALSLSLSLSLSLHSVWLVAFYEKKTSLFLSYCFVSDEADKHVICNTSDFAGGGIVTVGIVQRL